VGYDIVFNELHKRTTNAIVLKNYPAGQIEMQKSHKGRLLQLEVYAFDYLSFGLFIFLLRA
jgi:hypothetical protein